MGTGCLFPGLLPLFAVPSYQRLKVRSDGVFFTASMCVSIVFKPPLWRMQSGFSTPLSSSKWPSSIWLTSTVSLSVSCYSSSWFSHPCMSSYFTLPQPGTNLKERTRFSQFSANVSFVGLFSICLSSSPRNFLRDSASVSSIFSPKLEQSNKQLLTGLFSSDFLTLRPPPPPPHRKKSK
jgi:hypothetical protein